MNEDFVFSLTFSTLSLMLLFGSNRTVSLGVFLLTVCCSFAVTNLICPTLAQTLRDASDSEDNGKSVPFMDTLQHTWNLLRVKVLTFGLV